MTSSRTAPVFIFAAWLAVIVAAILFRPLMPVDETRYLSVAWEMMQRDSWLLPTLNFEPYSHKPPLLFWLVRASWEVFGVSVMAPRMMIFAAGLLLFFMAARLARALFPDAAMPERSALLLMAMPALLVYASVIMFDTLLAVFVIAAMLALWRAAQTPGWKAFVVLGAALGFGILTKGPVALVYMLPAALLGPVWAKGINKKRWYGGILLAFGIGAAIALSWAVPAAIEGGPAYAQKIFVTQSAARMVKAFDHVEPFWFYAPVLIGFLLPLLAWPALWRKISLAPAPVKFLACWAIPAVFFFSLISSKSIHYMVPVLPAFAIAAAYYADGTKARWTALPVVLLGLPSLLVLAMPAWADEKLFGTYAWLAALHGLGSLAAAAYIWKRPGQSFRRIACASAVFVIVAHAQLSHGFLPRYDLTPIASAVQAYADRPMAAAPKYDGEYGFVLRAQKHIASVGREDADTAAWFARNPNGVMIGRYKPHAIPPQYNILFQQDFRREEVLVILEKK